ncbi:MAG: hypothetical protein DME25_06365 [Verrucomicrobia bacterium]|nr:MAG: hypothetical protein DME25_06365 [Verrucomicrobiota bacterium]
MSKTFDRALLALLAGFCVWLGCDFFVDSGGPIYYSTHPLHLLCLVAYAVSMTCLAVLFARSKRGNGGNGPRW